MDCNEFNRCWPDLIAGTMVAEDRQRLQLHSNQCAACRKIWQEHNHLSDDLQGMIRIAPADSIAEEVKKEVGTMQATGRQPEQGPIAFNSSSIHASSLLFGVILGILLGWIGSQFSMGNARQPGMQQQYMLQQLGPTIHG